jgi:hypothetical protein
MTMTDKPSQTTDAEYDAVKRWESVALELEKERDEARALILPSSCSSSHQEIRYTGEKCPLCEVRTEIGRFSERIAASQVDLYPEDAALLYGNLWELYGPLYGPDAALSRPSEAPAPMPECLPECHPLFFGSMDYAERFHAPTCPNKPGAGEEGK